MSKNNMMYFWRVIFTYLIALHHLRNCYGLVTSWYIAVDFFAITSGYLLIYHIENKKNETLLEYSKKRFFQFCPLIFITSMLRLLVENWYTPSSINVLFEKIVRGIPDYLVLNAYYIAPSLNPVDWYIQMLFAISIPLFYLLKEHKKFTIQFVAPIFVLLSYSYIFKQFNYLEGYAVQRKVLQGIINMPIIMVGGGIMLGILGYCWSKNFNMPKNKWILEISLFSIIIYLSLLHGKDSLEFIYILAIFYGITLAFSHEVKLPRFVKYLSDISIYIYLSHYIVRIIFRQEFQTYSIYMVLLYVLSVTFFSILLHFVMKNIKFICKRGTND